MPTSIEVSIPVKLGGYTGQRDAWEEYEQPYVVRHGAGTVTLESTSSIKRRITFQLDDLNEAIQFLRGQIERQASDHVSS